VDGHLIPRNLAANDSVHSGFEARMQPCKLATGILIGLGILPPGQFLNVHKIRIDFDNKR